MTHLNCCYSPVADNSAAAAAAGPIEKARSAQLHNTHTHMEEKRSLCEGENKCSNCAESGPPVPWCEQIMAGQQRAERI